jgi:FlaA1/EpsC-like NDP-sugar epimerase
LVSSLDGKNSGEIILITGAGGCIGSALVRSVVTSGAKLVVLVDHSEQNLYEIHSELTSVAGPAVNVPILGDISDKALLDELLEKYRPDTIFHAAAFKHVPLMEANPIAVIRNNVVGTWTLANAALQHGVRKLLMISTDKAANPRSVMGAAKRVAELTLLCLSSAKTRMSALRLVNVVGSSGSVVPLFQQQIERGGPVTVTHQDCQRYFLSLPETIDLILAAAALNETGARSMPERGASAGALRAVVAPGSWGALFAPELSAPVKIVDLAESLIREAGPQAAATQIVFTGLRPGDKLNEDLISTAEWFEPTTNAKLRKINGPQPSPKILDTAIQLIAEEVSRRNLAPLVEILCELVPDYQPSEALRATLQGATLVGAQHCCAPSTQS